MHSETWQRFFTAETVRALAYPPPGIWMQRVPPGAVNLAAGYPFPESVPVQEMQEAFARLALAEGDRPFQYAGSDAMAGLDRLLTDGLRARGLWRPGDAVLVTAGALQALDLLCRVILDGHVAALVEAPTYMEALEVLRNYTPHLRGVPVGPHGLEVEALGRLLHTAGPGEPRPRLLYTGPTFQNPTGTTLPEAARRTLLDLAEQFDFLIAEDAAYAELFFSPPPPALKQLDTGGRVIHIGSLSKVIAPGLRIGWAVGPAPVIEAMALYKKDLDHPFSRALVGEYLRGTDLEARLQRLRAAYRERAARLVQALRAHMPEGVTWTEPAGGYFVWLTLPEPVPEEDLLAAARAEGVAYVPGRHFYLPGEAPSRARLRLSFSYAPPEALDEGVRRLGAALRRFLR
ncbi:aminotransferase-like domain-containing protein [Caldinitratiruptor microaerophilus]|uniref:Aminotransferase n=1 Tax=Caldinitratiruptor microaerophilus TaxID=671077 RepID=A0AA35CJA9_9FIRM|nr:PLP-dependent aminotransferase family protein [Caldinitratiruptor microaerophilus]BDG60142.1 aminotransferase [Caldinitratiruptor microaerophilus]